MNWRDRISAAQIRGAFTTQDLRDAASWTGCPIADTRGLGIEFYRAVEANDFDRAREIMIDIEERLPVGP